MVNWRQCHGQPWIIDEEWRLHLLVRTNRWATVAQIDRVNAGSDRKMSEYTVHCSLLRMVLHSHRPVRVPMLTPKSTNNGHMSIRTGPRSNGRPWPGLMNHIYFYITWMRFLPGEHICTRMHYEGKMEETMWCFGQCSPGKPWVWSSMWNLPPT